MDVLNPTFLDPLGVGLSLICTYYSVTANIKTWPIGIAASSVDIILYYQSGLYADMATSMLWIVMFSYGWRYWKVQDDPLDNQTGIQQLSGLQLLMFTSVILLIAGLVGLYLAHYTDSVVPYRDSLTAVGSIGAQWLLCRKYIQTWLLWFVVDAMYVQLYFDKDLLWHSGLLVLYVIMAIAGYLKWSRLANPRPLVNSTT